MADSWFGDRPIDPQKGDVWYDAAKLTVNVWTGVRWAYAASTPPITTADEIDVAVRSLQKLLET